VYKPIEMQFVTSGLILAVLVVAATFGRGGPVVSVPDIPTVEHCALVANPASYDGKEIRVRGVYAVCGTDDSKFFSSSCSDSNSLWVEFDPTYQTCSKSKAVKLLAEMTRKSGVRWGRPHVTVIVADYRAAEVEFVGTFTASNPYKQPEVPQTTESPFRPIRSNQERADFVFKVSCVEKVKPLPQHAKY